MCKKYIGSFKSWCNECDKETYHKENVDTEPADRWNDDYIHTSECTKCGKQTQTL